MGSLRLILKNSLKTTNQLAAGRLFACNHSTCTCVSFFSPAPDVPSAELPPSRRAEPTQSHCWTHLRVGSMHSSTHASLTVIQVLTTQESSLKGVKNSDILSSRHSCQPAFCLWWLEALESLNTAKIGWEVAEPQSTGKHQASQCTKPRAVICPACEAREEPPQRRSHLCSLDCYNTHWWTKRSISTGRRSSQCNFPSFWGLPPAEHWFVTRTQRSWLYFVFALYSHHWHSILWPLFLWKQLQQTGSCQLLSQLCH